ncbi:MAG TPA: PilZ domain-containing protein [Gallionella sp.]|nr:PilZ domain-containing protein [Gallionella sp.]
MNETDTPDNTGAPDNTGIPDSTASPDSVDTPVSAEPQDVSTTASPPPSHHHLHGTEHRDSVRHIVRWHADVMVNGHVCQGIVHEISESGATLFLELNPQNARKLSLNLHVPPPDDKHAQHLVEVEGKMVYSIHDSEERLFRAGVHFTKFANGADPAFLASHLQSH